MFGDALGLQPLQRFTLLRRLYEGLTPIGDFSVLAAKVFDRDTVVVLDALQVGLTGLEVQRRTALGVGLQPARFSDTQSGGVDFRRALLATRESAGQFDLGLLLTALSQRAHTLQPETVGRSRHLRALIGSTAGNLSR